MLEYLDNKYDNSSFTCMIFERDYFASFQDTFLKIAVMTYKIHALGAN